MQSLCLLRVIPLYDQFETFESVEGDYRLSTCYNCLLPARRYIRWSLSSTAHTPLCVICCEQLETRVQQTKGVPWHIRLRLIRQREILMCRHTNTEAHMDKKSRASCIWCGISPRRMYGMESIVSHHGDDMIHTRCKKTIDQLLVRAEVRERRKMHKKMWRLWGLPRDILRVVIGVYWSLIDIRQSAADSRLWAASNS